MEKEEKRQSVLPDIHYINSFVLPVFLTSKIWMPDLGDLIEASTFYTAYQFNDRQVTIHNWEYAKEQGMMEIQLEIENNTLDGIDSYGFYVFDNNANLFTIEKVIEDPDYVVLIVSDIPEKWSEIAVQLYINEADQKPDNSYESLLLYTNKDAIARTDQIIVKSKNDYLMARMDRVIENYSNEIDELYEEIEELQELKSVCLENIIRYENQKAYKTDEEIAELNRMINSAENKINSYNTQIETNESKISNLEERILNAYAQKAEYE